MSTLEKLSTTYLNTRENNHDTSILNNNVHRLNCIENRTLCKSSSKRDFCNVWFSVDIPCFDSLAY